MRRTIIKGYFAGQGGWGVWGRAEKVIRGASERGPWRASVLDIRSEDVRPAKTLIRACANPTLALLWPASCERTPRNISASAKDHLTSPDRSMSLFRASVPARFCLPRAPWAPSSLSPPTFCPLPILPTVPTISSRTMSSFHQVCAIP